jgi:hypothetical protein
VPAPLDPPLPSTAAGFILSRLGWALDAAEGAWEAAASALAALWRGGVVGAGAKPRADGTLADGGAATSTAAAESCLYGKDD